MQGPSTMLLDGAPTFPSSDSRFMPDWILPQLQHDERCNDASVPSIEKPMLNKFAMIVHLYSGRRRQGDLHDCILAFADRCDAAIVALSLDIVNGCDQ